MPVVYAERSRANLIKALIVATGEQWENLVIFAAPNS